MIAPLYYPSVIKDTRLRGISDRPGFYATYIVPPGENTGGESVTNKDITYYVNHYINADYYSTYQIVAPGLVEIVNMTPDICSVGGNLVASYVSTGTGRVKVTTKQINTGAVFTDILEMKFSALGGQSWDTYSFTSYVPGSLAKHINDTVNSMVSGKNPSTDKNVYSILNHGWWLPEAYVPPNYQRNPNLWCANMVNKLTCASPYHEHQNPAVGGLWGGTAITPRNVITCEHVNHLNPGIVLRFITPDNQLIKRTVVAYGTIPNSDLRISTLDEDLPASIVPAKYLPSTWKEYIPSLSLNLGGGFGQNALNCVPAINFDQFEKVSVLGVSLLTDSDPPLGAGWLGINNVILPWLAGPIPGDSGNPILFPINGELAIISVFTYPWAGSFTSLYLSQINSEIASQAAAAHQTTYHQVSTIDLSSFTNYA